MPDPRTPWPIAAELQDHLLTVSDDLDRLQGLLDEVCGALSKGFYAASDELRAARPDAAAVGPRLDRAIGHLSSTVPALQFQDMGTQLIAHTRRRLRYCADRLAADAFACDDDDATLEPAPLQPNPVTQDEMDAGSVELF